jgi:SAM-dependent methyltransferase
MSTDAVLAKNYDSSMGDMTGKVSFIRGLLKEHAPLAETVLEFACGTGTIMGGLSDSYQVAGFDVDPEMVKVAKTKLPSADIRLGDMTSYDFGRKCDAVLCIFNSINYLETWADWASTFRNAHRHLNPGGVFVFDFTTIERFAWTMRNPPIERDLEDGSYLIMWVWKDGDRYVWENRLFSKGRGGRFVLHKTLGYESSFPVDQVKAELEEPFSIEAAVDPSGSDPSDPAWRPFFVCKKR